MNFFPFNFVLKKKIFFRMSSCQSVQGSPKTTCKSKRSLFFKLFSFFLLKKSFQVQVHTLYISFAQWHGACGVLQGRPHTLALVRCKNPRSRRSHSPCVTSPRVGERRDGESVKLSGELRVGCGPYGTPFHCLTVLGSILLSQDPTLSSALFPTIKHQDAYT